MLKVTLDVFSGRPNPSWILAETEAQEILKEINNNRAMVAEVNSGYQGLGYRGITLEILSDDATETANLPNLFQIANGASLYESKGLELAERLISGMSNDELRVSALGSFSDFDETLRRQLLDHLGTFPKLASLGEPDSSSAMSDDMTIASAVCRIERSAFNPNFWNNPAHQSRNNCYNYAVNRRTDTFAQPGRATGTYPYPMDCASVRAAALSDGAHKRYDCLPESEKPRYLIALVVAPGVDYHWYRSQKEGFWGHKPGGTPAKNVDNSGNLITNPETCDRTSGWPSYTQFCGYFYRAKSMQIR